jgi:hypothetical protein
MRIALSRIQLNLTEAMLYCVNDLESYFDITLPFNSIVDALQGFKDAPGIYVSSIQLIPKGLLQLSHSANCRRLDTAC